MLTYDRLFLGGTWHCPRGSDTIAVTSPATEEIVGRVPSASKDDARSAVAYARDAFDTGPWSRMSTTERIARVQAFGQAIEQRSDAFADVLCAEQGLPRHALPGGQVAKAVATFEAFADIAGDFGWADTRQGARGRTLRVRRVPVGVITAIVPWNAPLFVASMKLAPALVAGNAVVLKPPVETPLHTYLLAEAALAADLPPGVLNIVPAGPEVSEQLVRDPDVDKVSFTGSTAVGRHVGAICGQTLTRVTLELGGKSPAVVLDDFELTAPNLRMLTAGVMTNAGQVCAAQTRVLAPRGRYQEIVEGMADAAASLTVGDPLEPTTDIGPLISQRQRDRVERYIAIGRAEGASLVTGGARPDIERGFYVEPTVFAEVDNSMTIAREEIFGPVAAIVPYDGDEHAVALANDSDYGLAGAVWTNDIDRGETIASQIRTGSVAVNSPGALDVYGTFGGFKCSGIGREGGPESLASYTEPQTILLPKQ